MVQSAQYPRIGGCQRDKTLFYMGSTGGLCPFCAQAPDFVANLPVATAPFDPIAATQPDYIDPLPSDAGAAEGMPSAAHPDDTAAPAVAAEIPTSCPACSAPLRAVVSEGVFELVLDSTAPPTETPAAEDTPLPAAAESPLDDGAGSDGAEGATTPAGASTNDPAPSPDRVEDADGVPGGYV
jgi:hypothetical protein